MPWPYPSPSPAISNASASDGIECLRLPQPGERMPHSPHGSSRSGETPASPVWRWRASSARAGHSPRSPRSSPDDNGPPQTRSWRGPQPPVPTSTNSSHSSTGTAHEFAAFKHSYSAEGGPAGVQAAWAIADQAATRLSFYQPILIHALLQRPEYARAVLTLPGEPADHGAGSEGASPTRTVTSRPGLFPAVQRQDWAAIE